MSHDIVAQAATVPLEPQVSAKTDWAPRRQNFVKVLKQAFRGARQGLAALGMTASSFQNGTKPVRALRGS